MIVKAIITSQNNKIRNIEIPDDEVSEDEMELLERVFYYGQNDFQPVKNTYSLSVGDIVVLNNRLWLVKGIGWELL